MTSAAVTPRMLRTLKFFNFMVYGAIAIYSTFFALYLKEIGVSTFQIGLLVAGGPIVGLICNPIWAYWADRIRNNKRILQIALIGNFAAMQFVFMTKNYVLIYAVMLFFFAFQSPLFTQSNSLILNVIEGTKYKFGAFRLWGSLGWALIALAAGPLIGWIGIHQLWIIYDAMMLITIAFTFSLPRGNERPTEKSFSNKGYLQLFTNKPFIVFVLLGVLISVPNSINMTFSALYIDSMGGSNTMVGWSAFAVAILEVPVFLLLDRYLKKRVPVMFAWLTLVSFLFAVRWFLMSIAVNALQVVFIQLLHSITFGGYYYIGTQLTATMVPGEYRSSGQAIYGLTWGGISGVIAGTAGGWLYEAIGVKALYQWCGLTTVLGFFGFVLLWLYTHRSANLNKAEREVALSK